MQTKFTKSPCLEQSSPVATEGVDYVSHIPWLIELGFDPIDVLCLVADLLAARQRQEDNRAV